MKPTIAIKPKWYLTTDDTSDGLVPLKDAWLVIQAGRIEEITSTCPDSIPSQLRFDRPEWIILPGLINSHCHLEFSDLECPLPADPSFAAWIGSVVKHRFELAQNPHFHRSHAVYAGVIQAWETGTRFVFDTVTSPWETSWVQLAQTDIRKRLSPLALSLYEDSLVRVSPCAEVLDINQVRKAETLAFYRSIKSQNPDAHISPHAPYTTSIELVQEAVSLANQADSIVSMHLAESKDEMDWLFNQNGPFLSRLAPFRDESFHRSHAQLSDYLRSLALANRLLVAHGNYLTNADLLTLAKRSSAAAIVHCPRTYEHFKPEGRDSYPLLDRVAAGTQHFLGTDSRASNPDLSMWREFQWAAKAVTNPHDIGRLLGMMTALPAHFFRQHDLGVIKPGSSAMLNCVPNARPWPDSREELVKFIASESLHPSPLEWKLTELTSD